MLPNNLALIAAVTSIIITLIGTLIGVGVQYGIYTSFKAKIELDMQALISRVVLLEDEKEEQNIKYATLLTKVESLKESSENNWERLFHKLEKQDDKIGILVEKVAKLPT